MIYLTPLAGGYTRRRSTDVIDWSQSYEMWAQTTFKSYEIYLKPRELVKEDKNARYCVKWKGHSEKYRSRRAAMDRLKQLKKKGHLVFMTTREFM